MVYLISRDSKKKLRVVEISCEWEDNAYMLKLISSIKTMNELSKMYISLGDVEFDINRIIKSELRNDYLKRLRDSLKEYALNEFKADLNEDEIETNDDDEVDIYE